MSVTFSENGPPKNKSKQFTKPLKQQETSRKVKQTIQENQEPFLTFEDVPDFWDEDQEPNMIPILVNEHMSFFLNWGEFLFPSVLY